MAGCGGWAEEMERRGVLRDGAGVQPASDATTVRVRGGDVLLSDGRFAASLEALHRLIERCDKLGIPHAAPPRTADPTAGSSTSPTPMASSSGS
jgi:hypothetical protein